MSGCGMLHVGGPWEQGQHEEVDNVGKSGVAGDALLNFGVKARAGLEVVWPLAGVGIMEASDSERDRNAVEISEGSVVRIMGVRAVSGLDGGVGEVSVVGAQVGFLRCD